ncbi:uroporphyrinogen decarboxylase family protein [Chloroflexota bacterium]
MPQLTNAERVFRVLDLKEPDVVPHFEFLINKKVRDAILPGATYEKFVDFMDLDAVVVFDKIGWSYETLDVEKKITRDQWGAIVRFTSEDIGHPMEACIKSEKDLDIYVPPDPDHPWRYEKLKALVERYKGRRAIIATVYDVFDVARESLLGDVAYFKYMITNPELVDRANDIVLNYQLGYLRNCIDIGADIIMVTGDFATTQGPMVSPKHTARFLIPPLQKMVEYVQSRGVRIIKHSDGNIWKIFDLIVETGVNGVHPIDPEAGMDIGEAKVKYGDKVCLLGNIDCGPLLSWGTVEEVRQAVKECIRKAGMGGGLICMSSNSIHSAVNPENYVAMVKAIREYGKYPLALTY